MKINQLVSRIVPFTALATAAFATSAFALDNAKIDNGNDVVTKEGVVGTVVRATGPNQIEFLADGETASRVLAVTDVAKTDVGNCERSYKIPLCVGDPVITGGGHDAIVMGFFADGQIGIVKSGEKKLELKKSIDLGVTTKGACYPGKPICVGQTVVTEHGNEAIVVGLMQDETVMVSSSMMNDPHRKPIKWLRDTNGQQFSENRSTKPARTRMAIVVPADSAPAAAPSADAAL